MKGTSVIVAMSLVILLCLACSPVMANESGVVNGLNVPAPVANFEGTPLSGTAPLTVQFTDASSNTPTSWVWYFGDETYTQAWTQQTASVGWSARSGHTSLAMPDGSIVLMGGNLENDVWRSTDNGAHWTRVCAASERGVGSIVMPDGSIVLMGDGVWRSTDYGVTWTQQTPSAGWSGRDYDSSVAMPDGSIVLMGGRVNRTRMNDVWRSTDTGVTWTQMTANASWAPREYPTSVAMPDGSIVLIGGYYSDGPWGYIHDVWRSTDNGAHWAQVCATAPGGSGPSVAMPDGSIVLMGYSDVWRSTNYGAHWTQVNASPGWPAREGHTSVAMPDGSIVLMGGGQWVGTGNNFNRFNDVWRSTDKGATWTQQTASVGWSERSGHTSVALSLIHI